MEAVAPNLNYPCDNSPTVSQLVCLLRHTYTNIDLSLHWEDGSVVVQTKYRAQFFLCKCVYIRQRYTHDKDIVTTELSVVQLLVY